MVDRLFAARIAASDSLTRDLAATRITGVTRVPLGVDLTTFHPALRERRAQIRRRLGVADDAPMVVYVGRIAPEKQLDVALRAWPRIAQTMNATLVLVGGLALLTQVGLTPIGFVPPAWLWRTDGRKAVTWSGSG